MEILVERKIFTSTSTISDLTVDGKPFGYVIEDTDRGLLDTMTPAEIAKIKVQDKTAIATGRYPVVVDFSNRFQKRLPLLLNVKGFAGVRFHPGNTANDSSACLLPGLTKAQNFVGSSKIAFANLFQAIQDAMATEKVYLAIKRDPVAYSKFLDARKAITA